jgi:hypothetical protein
MAQRILFLLSCLLLLYPVSVRSQTAEAAAPSDPARPAPTLFLPAIMNNQAPTLYLPAITNNRAPTAFGVQMYGALDNQWAPRASVAGTSWVRRPVDWATVEPVNTKPFNFNYHDLDATVQYANSLNLRLIVTIGNNPTWAATYANGPIDKVPLAEFAQFVQALVERYDGDGFQDAPGSPRVNVWELYNEPDGGYAMQAEFGIGYWGDYGKEYATMMCAAYQAARAADPAAKIAIGGIASDWFREDSGAFVRTFLDDVLANGGGRCMDYMNFHYYPYFQARWDAYGHGLVGKANYLRSKLNAYGLGSMPMIITEAGHHSNNYSDFPSSPEEQANFVVKLFTQAFAARAETMIWWTWLDIPGYWGQNGLLTQQGFAKLSFDAYAVATKKLDEVKFVREVPSTETGAGSAQVYQFAGSGTLYVAWVEGVSRQQVALTGRRFSIVNPMGIVQGYASDSDDGRTDEKVHIMIGQQPCYLERVE